jgi:predicted RNase H-like HicB family nuclease
MIKAGKPSTARVDTPDDHLAAKLPLAAIPSKGAGGRRPVRRARDRGSRCGDHVAESRTVTVPVIVERDEDGVWCVHARLRPGVGAHGEGYTEEAALEDLREALTGLIEEFGVPRELSITVAA